LKIRSAILQIPEPCTEKKENMLPHEKGRFCLKCQKAVHDISYMTDREIIKLLEENPGNLCVSAAKSQLGRELYPVPMPVSSPWKKWAFLGALSLPVLLPQMGFSQPAAYSSPKKKTAHHPLYPNVKNTSEGKMYVFSGRLTVERRHIPVLITIADSIKLNPDKYDGSFYREIPPSLFKNGHLKLVFEWGEFRQEHILQINHSGESIIDLCYPPMPAAEWLKVQDQDSATEEAIRTVTIISGPHEQEIALGGPAIVQLDLPEKQGFFRRLFSAFRRKIKSW
jgi:hypothetical protein